MRVHSRLRWASFPHEAPETSEDNNAEPGDADAPTTDRLPGMMHFIILSYGLHMGVWSCESEVVNGVAAWPYRGRYLTRVLWPNCP